jgi:PAS domain S-box-containing protein
MSLALDMSSKTQTSLKNEARQQSDERWQAAFENSTIGIMMADVNGHLFAANRVFRNMLGYSELELYQLTFLDVTYDEDRHNNLKLVRELVDGKRQHFQIEKRYRCKDGSLLRVRSNATLVPGEDGKNHSGLTLLKTLPTGSAWRTNSGCRLFDCEKPKRVCRRFSKQREPGFLKRPAGPSHGGER